VTQRESDKARQLDCAWDTFLDAAPSGEPADDQSRLLAQLHVRDDAPAPSSRFRDQLEAELRTMHPGAANIHSTAISDASDPAQETPATFPSGDPPERPTEIDRKGSFRQWGELAAMILILALAIAGAALFGDDAYDFAQQQISTESDDSDEVSDHRSVLEEEGEVSGLTFEEAQSLTPFEIAEISYVPEGLSMEGRSVERTSLDQRGRVFFTRWRSTTEITIAGSDHPPILVHQQPALESMSVSMPQSAENEETTGRLDTIDIEGTGAVRVFGDTDDDGSTTHVAWRQGDVDVWVEIPFDVSDGSNPGDGINELMSSIVDQGPLDDGADDIANRGMTLEQFREEMPTAPVADPTPEHLHLTRFDNWIYGPNAYYQHTANDEISDIWIRGMGGSIGETFHERKADAGAETVRVGDTQVSRHVLMDRYSPETAEFIEHVGLHAELLLPWISDGSDSAIVVYLWDVAGMTYLMGVEIPHDQINTDADDAPMLPADIPESDWLEIIESQEAFAAEHLDPEEIFPIFADEPGEEDQFPDVAYMSPREGDDIRLIGETENGQYYLALDDQRRLTTLYQFVDVEGEDQPRSSGGGSPLWVAAEYGISSGMGGGGTGYHVAYVLPLGYDEVVDENGEQIAEIENQLFAISFERGSQRPAEMIARGPAGELHLDIGTRSSESRLPTEQ
jgi:hypothetical protein